MIVVHAEPDSAVALAVLRRYYGDIVGRFHQRDATAAEVDAAMLDEPSSDLAGSSGCFVVAIDDGEPIGCGGVRFVGPGIAELTRVFVAPSARGLGAGSTIVLHLEGVASDSGRHMVRLDTRRDLIEARSLYLRLGYSPTEPFNSDPHADVWLSKTI